MSTGLSKALKLQMQPQIPHLANREETSSLRVYKKAKLISRAERLVSHSSQGMIVTGGEMAHAQPAMRPERSPNCSRPTSSIAIAVSAEKITFRKAATQIEAPLSIPNSANTPANRQG
jgi:hypothetical protein